MVGTVALTNQNEGPLASLVGTNDPGTTKRSRRAWVSTEKTEAEHAWDIDGCQSH